MEQKYILLMRGTGYSTSKLQLTAG
jgi:hypothetical protein